MKVLIVRPFPDILQLHAYNVQEIGLAKALTVRGIECGVVLYHGQKPDKTEDYSFDRDGREYTFPVYWLKGYNFLKNGFMPSVKNLIPMYDVIQVHEYDQLLSWKLYSNMKKPTLIYHGPYYHEFARGYNLKCKVFDALFLKKRSCEQVLALAKSELAAKFLQKKGFQNVRTVGVGIDSDNFSEQKRETLKPLVDRDTSKIRLLYVGKIEERRNVFFLVDLFEELKRRNDCFQLVIIGNGEEEYLNRFLEKTKSWREKGDIIYFPEAAQKELASVYRNTDLFVFTSNYDIFGMVLLEALFFGLPVISTWNGGSSVLLKDGVNGYIMEEFDVGCWAKKIESIFANQQNYQSMKKEAHKLIEEGFLWDNLADRFVEGYQEAQQLFKNHISGQ